MLIRRKAGESASAKADECQAKVVIIIAMTRADHIIMDHVPINSTSWEPKLRLLVIS